MVLSGNSSSPGETTLRPGRVLLLVVLAESQSDASVSLTQEAVGKLTKYDRDVAEGRRSVYKGITVK